MGAAVEWVRAAHARLMMLRPRAEGRSCPGALLEIVMAVA